MNRPIAILFLALAASTAWARGGGGCFAEGTPIATPGGDVAIERLRPGDAVWTIDGDTRATGRVAAVTRFDAERFCEIVIGDKTLRVTAEHPFLVGTGVFRTAGSLRAGDEVRVMSGDRLAAARIASVRVIETPAPAFNLLVAPGNTYLAGGVAVHNKGCFLPDTPILRADGSESPIATLRPGDGVMSFTLEGGIVRARVREVITHEVDEYCVVKTESAVLRVTAEHPFYVGRAEFRTVEAIRVGDRVGVYSSGGLRFERVLGIDRVAQRTRVFNLQTDEPHTYFAHGVAVHNKGGGCFPAGTRIATPSGDVAIEKLHSGSPILAVTDDGRVVASSVRELVVREVGEYLVIATGSRSVRATPDHPFSVGGGVFRPAGEMAVGDRIGFLERGRIVEQRVTRIDRVVAPTRVYNLKADEPHTFFADGFAVHNKGGGGGCLVPGTPVATPRGAAPIESLRPGDNVLAFTDENRIVTATVRRTYALEAERSLRITIAGRTIGITDEHPVALGGGRFVRAGSLRVGDRVLVHTDESLNYAGIDAIERVSETTAVHNLETDEPHTFIAGGVAVHNKGGFGGSRSGSSGGSGKSWSEMTFWERVVFVLFFAFFGIVVFWSIFGGVVRWMLGRAKDSGELDHLCSPREVKAKASRTQKLAEYLAARDAMFKPDALKATAESTFRKLQECWQARAYEPMRPLLMSDLFASHLGQIEAMKRQREINVIENLVVNAVRIVHIRQTEKADGREFTALITAQARDYYVDDRTKAFRRGDRSSARFQEFWTFQQWNGKWLLREIEQTKESSVLKDENEVETMSAEKLAGVYGEAGAPAPAGKWNLGLLAGKAERTDDLLDKLKRIDPLWNRQRMKDRARQVFLRVLHAREAGSDGAVPVEDMLPEAADTLRAQITAMTNANSRIEYRNLCVRRVEIVLIRNFRDNAKDSFMARVTAHAQLVTTNNGIVTEEDSYVTAFAEYWEFARTPDGWKLRKAYPAGEGGGDTSGGNIDEDRVAERRTRF